MGAQWPQPKSPLSRVDFPGAPRADAVDAAENPDPRFWHQRRVFVTGHTGFKGGWLCAWLLKMDAAVTGYALPPPSEPSFYALCGLERRLASLIADVRDLDRLCQALASARPSVVFHMAAQSLVRRSYREPVETFATNVMGTVNLLEAVRRTPSVKAVVIATSDKCYDNREWLWGYRENDRLGGRDPYSASKACAELAIEAYRRSFFSGVDAPGVASVRAGNVIGGGDWGEDRLVPDAVRAVIARRPLILRHPEAIRPWQHVLDPLSGYLRLAERLAEGGQRFAEAWNFGPASDQTVTVRALAEKVVEGLGGGTVEVAQSPVLSAAEASDAAPETAILKLDATRARRMLGWRPRLDLAQAIGLAAEWYRRALDGRGADMLDFTNAQIDRYERLTRSDAAAGLSPDSHFLSLPPREREG